MGSSAHARLNPGDYFVVIPPQHLERIGQPLSMGRHDYSPDPKVFQVPGLIERGGGRAQLAAAAEASTESDLEGTVASGRSLQPAQPLH